MSPEINTSELEKHPLDIKECVQPIVQAGEEVAKKVAEQVKTEVSKIAPEKAEEIAKKVEETVKKELSADPEKIEKAVKELVTTVTTSELSIEIEADVKAIAKKVEAKKSSDIAKTIAKAEYVKSRLEGYASSEILSELEDVIKDLKIIHATMSPEIDIIKNCDSEVMELIKEIKAELDKAKAGK